jgi:hypothetical protein
LAKPLHPWQQKKAHQEIDTIVNAEMLPDFSEMKHRPHGFPLIEEVIQVSHFCFENGSNRSALASVLV